MQTEVNRIKNEITSIYEERINIRKAISELHEQNLHNTLEIKFNLANLLMWKKQDINMLDPMCTLVKRQLQSITDIPPEIAEQFNNVAILRKNYEKNQDYRSRLKSELQENFQKVEMIKKGIPDRIKSLEFREMLDTLLKNHIIELHNQEMDYQLRKQAKLIEELNEVILAQKKTMQAHGIVVDSEDFNVISEDENEFKLMEEFDKESNPEVSQIDKDVEEELVEQLEDFETLRDNQSEEDNQDNNNGDELECDEEDTNDTIEQKKDNDR